MALILFSGCSTSTTGDVSSLGSNTPTGPSNTPPSISNFRFNPVSTVVNFMEGNILTVQVIFDFKDTEGDIITAKLLNVDTGKETTHNLISFLGDTSATVNTIGVIVDIKSPSTTTFQVWAIDQKGNESNKLEMSFEVI